MRLHWLIAMLLVGCAKPQGADSPRAVDAATGPSGEAAATHPPTQAIPVWPTTVHDQAGRAVTLATPPRRIVSLSPALTETLFAVGCGRQVVLRDGWSDWPPEARSIHAVQGFTPSAEAILAARPDLVLTHFPPPALATALDGARIGWLGFAPRTLAEVAQAIDAVGQACGQPAQGARLAAQFRERVRQIHLRVEGRPVPRVFYEMDAGVGGQPFTIGNQTFGHELLGHAVAENVFAGESREWFQVSPESVLDADPDAVLLGDADAQDRPQTLESLRHRPTMALLRAVRTGQVFGLHAAWVARPGPRLVFGLEEVARQLHPVALLDLPLLAPLGENP